MPDTQSLSVLSIYLSGAFGGICVLVMVLSFLIAYAYNERMLGWHAATLAAALAAQALSQDSPQLAFVMCTTQLALAVQTLCKVLGTGGALRKPAFVVRVFSVVAIVATLLLLVFEALPAGYIGTLLLPWFAITLWYLSRARASGKPWLAWLALGQFSLLVQWVMGLPQPQGYLQFSPQVGSLAALAAFASTTYIGMVWKSRMSSENTLRVEARERVDPLTGLAMPRVFFDRVDGAIIRSKQLGYACALMLIRVDNIDQIVADHELESPERVVLTASRAIADALRSQDTATRLAGNRFSVMLEGLEDDTANKIATKILANGLRASEWGLPGSDLQLQIVMVELDGADVASAEVLVLLEDCLRKMSIRAGSSRIRTLPRITSARMPLQHFEPSQK